MFVLFSILIIIVPWGEANSVCHASIICLYLDLLRKDLNVSSFSPDAPFFHAG